MTKLCPRGKAAAKRKFSVYPSAYANAYASKICAGKIKDPSGVKRKDFKGPKPAGKKVGGEAKVKINEVIGGLKKASKTHAAQAKTLETLKANSGKSIEVLKEESQKIIDNFPKKKKKKYVREPQSRDKFQPSKSMLVDYGKKVTTVENYSRGGGIAIRGMGFKGVF
jgi:hypothetical protein